MQSDISSGYTYSQAHGLCTMCSGMMFVFGTFLSVSGFVVLSDPQNLVVGLLCLGMGAATFLLATCFCCHVKRERSRQFKYLANGSSLITKLDRIETRLAQQSNVSFPINPPVAHRVVVQFILFIVTEDFTFHF